MALVMKFPNGETCNVLIEVFNYSGCVLGRYGTHLESVWDRGGTCTPLATKYYFV